jgi:predicted lactoylglutathione lyase
MKRILLLISLFFCAASYSQLNDLTIHYTGTNYKKATDKKAASQYKFTSTYYYSKGKLLISNNYPNFKAQTIIANHTILILTETGNYKFFSSRTISDSNKAKQKINNISALDHSNEKKIILGYSCMKISRTKKEVKGDSTYQYGWVTDNLPSQIPFELIPEYSEFKIPNKHIVLEIGKENSKSSYRMIATEISTKPIPDSVFNLSTKGYKEIQKKDSQNKKS